MIELENTVVSDLVLDRKFVCDLNACKGGCCISGASGAPLEAEEENFIKINLDKIKPYMIQKGIDAVDQSGVSAKDSEGNLVTSLMEENGACSFVYYDSNNIAKCAIEAAYNDKKIEFKKPISCHLYPIRITSYKDFDAVNYHERDMCKPACECGAKLGVKVYKFLKEPLIRKYGLSWYEKLEAIDKISS